MVEIRRLVNGSEVSRRQFVWCGGDICEERNVGGVVTKRFFDQGMKVENGSDAGSYFYTRDHLGSIRYVTDVNGNVRAQYDYDPYGRRTRLAGNIEADFGFAGMFWSAETELSLTHFRAYDSELGRWLSRDPLQDAEIRSGPNLYAYAVNNPINRIDPDGLIPKTTDLCAKEPGLCLAIGAGTSGAGAAASRSPSAIQAAGEQIARCGQAVWGRVQAIAERVPEALRLSQQYLDDLVADIPSGERMLNFAKGGLPQFYPGYPQFLIEVDAAFADAAALIAARYGISLEQAAALLTRYLGYAPVGG
jgi:RHS repeat-associated protein